MNLKQKNTVSNDNNNEVSIDTNQESENKNITLNEVDEEINDIGTSSNSNNVKNEMLNLVTQKDNDLKNNNKEKSIVIPTQIPIMPKSNLKNKAFNKDNQEVFNKNENVRLNTPKNDTENIMKNTINPISSDGFIELKIKDNNNVIEITPKPLIQSDEDSDEFDEYESSDNEDNRDEEEEGEKKNNTIQYPNSMSYAFIESDIETEHELNKDNKSDNDEELDDKEDQQGQIYHFKKAINDLVLNYENKSEMKGKEVINNDESQDEIIDKDDSIVFTNLNDIKDQYENVEFKNNNDDNDSKEESSIKNVYKIDNNAKINVSDPEEKVKSNDNSELDLDNLSDIDIDEQNENQINNELLKYILNNNEALLSLYNSSEVKNLDSYEDDDNELDDSDNEKDNNHHVANDNNESDTDDNNSEDEDEDETNNNNEEEFDILNYLYNLEKKQNSLVQLKKKLKRLQDAQANLIKQQQEYKNELNNNSLDEKDHNNEDEHEDKENLPEHQDENNEKETNKDDNSKLLNTMVKKDDYSNEDLDRLNNLLQDILVEESNSIGEKLINDKNDEANDDIDNNIFAKLIEINKKQEELKKLRKYMDYLKEYANIFNQKYHDEVENNKNEEKDNNESLSKELTNNVDNNSDKEGSKLNIIKENNEKKLEKAEKNENKNTNDENDNDLEDIYSSYDMNKSGNKNESNNKNNTITKDRNKYGLSYLDDLDQESQNLFEKLEELEQRQISLRKVLKSQSLSIEKEEKNIDQFINNELTNKEDNNNDDENNNPNEISIDSHIQEAIEAMRKISESDNLYHKHNHREVKPDITEEKKTERMNSVNSIVPSSQYDSDINNLLNNKLNEKIYNEVSNLISKNEKYPYFLLQLFRLCNKIENETQWQKILILIENLFDDDFTTENGNNQNMANYNDYSVPKGLPMNSNHDENNQDNHDNANKDKKANNDNSLLNNKTNGISEEMYDQLYNELDEALKNNNYNDNNTTNNNGNNNGADNQEVQKNQKINLENEDKKDEKDLSLFDNDDLGDLEDIDLDALDDKQACMILLEKKMRYENELKKLLQLQKEQIEYKEKIEKQLEEQKKILEIKKLYEQKKQEHDKQLNLTKELVNNDKDEGKTKLSATEEAKKFLQDNNDSLNYIFDELIKSKNVLAGDDNEGISPDNPIWFNKS